MSTCRKCGLTVVYATVTTREGRKPARMPLDPIPSEDGSVAIYRDAMGTLIGRVLARDEQPAGYQRLFVPHFAACKPRERAEPAMLPAGVTSLTKWRQAAGSEAAAGRNRRGRRPEPQVTGVRIDPGRQP